MCDFEFLDTDLCSPEEKEFLFGILKNSAEDGGSSPRQNAPSTHAPVTSQSGTVPHQNPLQAPKVAPQYVYINTVTSNVNFAAGGSGAAFLPQNPEATFLYPPHMAAMAAGKVPPQPQPPPPPPHHPYIPPHPPVIYYPYPIPVSQTHHQVPPVANPPVSNPIPQPQHRPNFIKPANNHQATNMVPNPVYFQQQPHLLQVVTTNAPVMPPPENQQIRNQNDVSQEKPKTPEVNSVVADEKMREPVKKSVVQEPSQQKDAETDTPKVSFFFLFFCFFFLSKISSKLLVIKIGNEIWFLFFLTGRSG